MAEYSRNSLVVCLVFLGVSWDVQAYCRRQKEPNRHTARVENVQYYTYEMCDWGTNPHRSATGPSRYETERGR